MTVPLREHQEWGSSLWLTRSVHGWGMLSFSAAAETISACVKQQNRAWTLAAVGAALGLCACGPGPGAGPGSQTQSAYAACPRPEGPSGHQPQFNQQQREIRALRERGFHGDFFAQLMLGNRYEARRDADRNLQDPIEAAVWYALALTNPQGYEAVAPRPLLDEHEGGHGDAQPIAFPQGPGALYDDCRAFERAQASSALGGLWQRMSSQEQDAVRQRMVYVLSTQGAPGYRVLARITQTDTGPFGAPREFPRPFRRHWWGEPHLPWGWGQPPVQQGPAVGLYPVELFTRNDVDSYLYDYLAAQSGDEGAYVMMKDFEAGSPDRAGYADFVEAKANRWIPPYEFYPPDSPSSGVPHADESGQLDEAGEQALSRIDELPLIHVVDALRYLRVVSEPAFQFDGHDRPWHGELAPAQVQAFQAMIGREQTGHMSALEKVRAVQYAAVNGSTHAQLVLAVMYSEGVGVRADYARAFHWYEEAARAGSPEAKFAIANYFSLGVGGVADQDKAKAVVMRMDSAMAGFQPQANHVQAVLAQVSRKAPY